MDETQTTVPAAADETVINATPEETIFVNLFKNEYEKNGKKLISYKPGYVKKDGGGIGTFPIGFGQFDIEIYSKADGSESSKNVYNRNFWLSVEVNDKNPDKGDILVTLNETDTKEYQKFYLVKRMNKESGKIGYAIEKPVEIAGTKYRANLSQNTKKDKPHLFNLIFKDAGAGTGGDIGSEAEISFDDGIDF